MSKLISTYAKCSGLRISRKGPNIQKVFYPTPHEKYITIQSGSNQGAKNYDYYNDVIRLIRPMLEANKIAILHLGGKDDPALESVIDLRGKTSYLQSNYLMSKTLLHLGNDSWLAHIAGMHYRPLLELMGSTSAHNHSPFWYDPQKTSILEAHRWGGKPTYVMGEQPKSINTIDPFHVANEVLRLLEIKHIFTEQTRFYGALSQHIILEIIPDAPVDPNFCPGAPITVRMDYLHNEAILTQTLNTGRKINIVTSAPINPNILSQFRGSILSYNHELTANLPEDQLPSVDYVTAVKTLCPRHVFFTKELDAKKLAQLRLRYFDYGNGVEQIKDTTREDYLKNALFYLYRTDTPENRLDLISELPHTKFRSSKFILSKGRVFLTLAHVQLGKSINSLTDNTALMMDDPLVWKELNHLSLFYDKPA